MIIVGEVQGEAVGVLHEREIERVREGCTSLILYLVHWDNLMP